MLVDLLELPESVCLRELKMLLEEEGELGLPAGDFAEREEEEELVCFSSEEAEDEQGEGFDLL